MNDPLLKGIPQYNPNDPNQSIPRTVYQRLFSKLQSFAESDEVVVKYPKTLAKMRLLFPGKFKSTSASSFRSIRRARAAESRRLDRNTKLMEGRGISPARGLRNTRRNHGNYLRITDSYMCDLDADPDQTIPLPSNQVYVLGQSLPLNPEGHVRIVRIYGRDENEVLKSHLLISLYEAASQLLVDEFNRIAITTSALDSIFEYGLSCEIVVDEVTNEVMGVVKYVVLKRYVYVDTLAIASNYQRRGIGSLLMNRMKQISIERSRPIFLYATCSAVEFYQKQGLKISTTWHSGDAETAVYMESDETAWSLSQPFFQIVPPCHPHSLLTLYLHQGDQETFGAPDFNIQVFTKYPIEYSIVSGRPKKRDNHLGPAIYPRRAQVKQPSFNGSASLLSSSLSSISGVPSPTFTPPSLSPSPSSSLMSSPQFASLPSMLRSSSKLIGEPLSLATVAKYYEYELSDLHSDDDLCSMVDLDEGPHSFSHFGGFSSFLYGESTGSGLSTRTSSTLSQGQTSSSDTTFEMQLENDMMSESGYAPSPMMLQPFPLTMRSVSAPSRSNTSTSINNIGSSSSSGSGSSSRYLSVPGASSFRDRR
ncbi:uncharacterized protein BJ171DRAFT_122302 [Polychytrium aggregatum]|uniref:uncharacterized protein n=1 Tax=Polychytrium aggregatum TaxID=110093 RepID=UPI0022FEAF69|nr:uncharacterized protein BJ171DRAFT_122302 [Polychytrium aggregatum]KAI9204275.1 hypothetical protein BJ171DRAFT_122302 [Polychytrium aggregatum]